MRKTGRAIESYRNIYVKRKETAKYKQKNFRQSGRERKIDILKVKRIRNIGRERSLQ